MNKKLIFHLILSTLLLLPVSIILENSDGLETVNTIKGYLIEWYPPIIFSLIISGIIFGVKKLLKKETSFLNIFYHSSYTISIIILLIVSLKYL
jgi:hypothetical protein